MTVTPLPRSIGAAGPVAAGTARLQRLSAENLDEINAVIRAAVLGWPLPDRVKRLSLPLLEYDLVDADQYRLLGAYQEDREALIGVAAWDDNQLHGLYVHPAAQGLGIGGALLHAVCHDTAATGIAGLEIKAQRISASYFEYLGLPALPPGDGYPYRFLLDNRCA